MTQHDEEAAHVMRAPMPPIFRSIVAVSAGMFVGGIAIFGVEALAHLLVPPPPGLDVTNPENVRNVMSTMPAAHFLPILLGYLIGPTVGAALTARMARSRPLLHASVMAGIFIMGALKNFMEIPHPIWFIVLALLAFMAAPFLGTKWAGK
ncbi:MAG: hypothetical protein ABIZ91_10070 [Gemmatimonadaceae bacterium]